MCCQVSVPSSSGNSLQRCRRDCGRRAALGFQSPLHRGTLFNRVQIPSRRRQQLVSVPSSSGNSLKLVQMKLPYELLQRFSPLFIGELSSTNHYARRLGRRCGFSPLFIGELSSTRDAALHRIVERRFQSPLHRGTLFNGIR